MQSVLYARLQVEKALYGELCDSNQIPEAYGRKIEVKQQRAGFLYC